METMTARLEAMAKPARKREFSTAKPARRYK